jgi:hypothetical protein
MFINVIILNVWHPGRYLPKSNKLFLGEDGQEISADRGGWDDERPFLLTLVDPFNITGLIKERREKKNKKQAENGNGFEADKKPAETA